LHIKNNLQIEKQTIILIPQRLLQHFSHLINGFHLLINDNYSVYLFVSLYYESSIVLDFWSVITLKEEKLNCTKQLTPAFLRVHPQLQSALLMAHCQFHPALLRAHPASSSTCFHLTAVCYLKTPANLQNHQQHPQDSNLQTQKILQMNFTLHQVQTQ
jgi:hypothetical protein